MTQPDLVSKLREVIAKVKPLMEKATPRPWEANHYEFDWSKWFLEHRNHPRFPNAKPSIAAMNTPCVLYSNAENDAALIVAAVSALDELESLLGREGQAAPATVPQRKVDFCGAVCMAWEDCGDKEYTHHCVLQADHQGKHKFSCSQVAQPAPSPSTPIVPGTAGLSAEQVQRIVELHHNDGIFLWASMTADLNTLFGAKPAECPCICCKDVGQGCSCLSHDIKERCDCLKCVRHMLSVKEFVVTGVVKQREAQIRKDVLEAARYFLSEVWIDNPDNSPLGIAEAIRALAERPVPAGEVKGEK